MENILFSHCLEVGNYGTLAPSWCPRPALILSFLVLSMVLIFILPFQVAYTLPSSAQAQAQSQLGAEIALISSNTPTPHPPPPPTHPDAVRSNSPSARD